MRRTLAFFTVLCIFLTFHSTCYASNNELIDLNQIAEKTINRTQEIQESGAKVNTYENIDAFFEKARLLYPNMSDKQLASFVIEYIGQDSSAMAEEDLLGILEYKSISSSTSYIKISENEGFQEISEEEAILAPVDISTSTDGYMQLDTSFALRKTVGSDKYFSVWTIAQWLKWPSFGVNDVLILSTNGTFDDSKEEFGYVNQAFKCGSISACTQRTYRNRIVDKNSPVNEDVTLKYSNFTPYISFSVISPRCEYCTGGMGPASDDSFRAYICYGIITSGTCNIQAHYGHTTLGITSINVSIKGEDVTITPGVGASVKQYTARAVTVK